MIPRLSRCSALVGALFLFALAPKAHPQPSANPASPETAASSSAASADVATANAATASSSAAGNAATSSSSVIEPTDSTATSPTPTSPTPTETTTTETTSEAAATEPTTAEPTTTTEPPATPATATPATATPATATPATATPATATPATATPATATPATATPATAESATAESAPIEYSKSGGRLTADVVSYNGGTIIAESRSAQGVVFQTTDTRVQADRIELDTVKRLLRATGKVVVERQRSTVRKPLVASSIVDRGIYPGKKEVVTETLRGSNLQYDFNTQRGSLDAAQLELAGFSVVTDNLTINGKRYTAHHVVLRPGGLSKEELDKYGTPPFSLRAREVTVEALNGAPSAATTNSSDNANVGATSGASGAAGANARRARVSVRGGGLYFGKTRLLPVPSYVFNNLVGTPRDPQAFSLTPRISLNSTDRVLVTTQLSYGLSRTPGGALLNADIGLSQRVGFRGGLSVLAPTRGGTFTLGLRRNDIVTSQLTSRIELDRTPELTYRSPLVPLFGLPGGRLAGISFSAGVGRFREKLIGDNDSSTSSDRSIAAFNFTTRGNAVSGPYLDVFARLSRYGSSSRDYRNAGFEVGYAGRLLPRVRGAISLRATSVAGQTPFRFDRVEIKRELRTTFDVELTPRYLIPFDFRYDLTQKRLRDQSVGLLRSYKDFAYGVVYQSSRREARLEIRQGF